MKRFAAIVVAVGLALPCLSETLTTDDVIRMAKAGLSAETIELKIRHSEVAFDTSTDALIALKEAGVSEATIRIMIDKAAVAVPTPAPAPKPTSGTTAAEPAPVVSATPVPRGAVTPPPPATSSAPAMYEVTVYNPSTGRTCSSGFLKIEQKGLGVSGCLGSNFTMTWSQIDSVCAAGGESTTIRLTTKSGVRELSAASVSERDEIGRAIVRGAPLVTCKD